MSATCGVYSNPTCSFTSCYCFLLCVTAGLVVLTGRDGGGVVGVAPVPHLPETVRGPGVPLITADGPGHLEGGAGNPLREGNPHRPKATGPGQHTKHTSRAFVGALSNQFSNKQLLACVCGETCDE